MNHVTYCFAIVLNLFICDIIHDPDIKYETEDMGIL